MHTDNKAQGKTSASQKIALSLLGLFLFLVILETGLRLGGFMILSAQEHRNMASLRQKGDFRILCLGESTTQRQYPFFLEEVLNQRALGMKFSVIDKGRAGIQTSGILGTIGSYLDQYHPDMVIAMMGINDDNRYGLYEVLPCNRAALSLRSMRTYKLAKLVWLHMVAKNRGALKDGMHAYSRAGSIPGEGGVEPREGKSVKEEAGDFPQRYKMALHALEFNPKNYMALVALGRVQRDRGDYAQAEASFKKAAELNPRNVESYVALGMLYKEELQDYAQAEASFKKAAELAPRNIDLHLTLGWLYANKGEYAQAEASFKKVVELDPRNVEAYMALGRLYKEELRDYAQAEASFRKALELSPGNYTVYCVLGELYREGLRDYAQAETNLKKAVALAPQDDIAYRQLINLYRDKGDYAQAEAFLKKGFELGLFRSYDRFYGILATLYTEKGQRGLAKTYYRRANKLRSEEYIPMTAANYHGLKATLDKQAVTLVCVQYPMRSIEPLKDIFSGEDGVVFVDNERSFRERVTREGYKEYFSDAFGGDFGHCTEKGNRLLAQNIADVLIREVFKR